MTTSTLSTGRHNKHGAHSPPVCPVLGRLLWQVASNSLCKEFLPVTFHQPAPLTSPVARSMPVLVYFRGSRGRRGGSPGNNPFGSEPDYGVFGNVHFLVLRVFGAEGLYRPGPFFPVHKQVSGSGYQ